MHKHNILIRMFGCRGLSQVSSDIQENLLVNITALWVVGSPGWLEPDTGVPPGLTLHTSHLCVMDSLYTKRRVVIGHSQNFFILSCLLVSDYYDGRLALLPLVLPGNILRKNSACFDLSHMPRRARHPTPLFLSGESHGQKAQRATVHRVAKRQTRLKWLNTYAHSQEVGGLSWDATVTRIICL